MQTAPTRAQTTRRLRIYRRDQAPVLTDAELKKMQTARYLDYQTELLKSDDERHEIQAQLLYKLAPELKKMILVEMVKVLHPEPVIFRDDPIGSSPLRVHRKNKLAYLVECLFRSISRVRLVRFGKSSAASSLSINVLSLPNGLVDPCTRNETYYKHDFRQLGFRYLDIASISKQLKSFAQEAVAENVPVNFAPRNFLDRFLLPQSLEAVNRNITTVHVNIDVPRQSAGRWVINEVAYSTRALSLELIHAIAEIGDPEYLQTSLPGLKSLSVGIYSPLAATRVTSQRQMDPSWISRPTPLVI